MHLSPLPVMLLLATLHSALCLQPPFTSGGIPQKNTSLFLNHSPPPNPSIYYALPPPQIAKNCKGSHGCKSASWLPSACRRSVALYDNNTIYAERTSRVAYRDGKTGACTAIWVCETGRYAHGMSGYQIKLAFERLLGRREEDGKVCKRCGSSYMAGGCHVTLNYCLHRLNDNRFGNGWTGLGRQERVLLEDGPLSP